MTKLKNLRVAHWNTHGLRHKIDCPDFVNILNDYDICILTETWMTEKIKIDNFYVEHIKAKKIPSKKGRFSGGLYILIKENIKEHVKILDLPNKYGKWLKIGKDMLKLDKHLYIGGIYLPPQDSTYALKEPFGQIENDVSELLTSGHIMILGDLNSRTDNLKDFIVNYSGDEKAGDKICMADNVIEPISRFNNDMVVNEYGKQLVQFCKNTDMLIMNGRMEGDIPGKYTFYNKNGSSTVDYGIVSNSFTNNILYFHVTAPNAWSDHCLIKTCISVDWTSTNKIASHNLSQLHDTYAWNSESPSRFIDTMNSDIIQKEIKNILLNNYSIDEKGIDGISRDVATIYQKTATLCLKKKTKNAHRRRTQNNHHNYLKTKQYNEMKKELKDLGYLLCRFPKDPFIRGKFFFMKKNFSKILKRHQAKAREEIMARIQQMEDKNPTAFWNLVNTYRDKKKNNEEINPDIFFEHFKKLHEGICHASHDKIFKQKIEHKLKSMKKSKWIDILDKSISEEEMLSTIKKTKNKKACGLDSISNEMIKCSVDIMKNVLLKLFNHILHTESFPTLWGNGYINPIYKGKGENTDPANFRGITISSCLGKVFTRILNERFINFLIKEKLIKINQIGFTPNKRTADHIFVLKTLIDQAKADRGHLYLCFIDLKAAFDTVWRGGLLYKLTKMKISSKFLNIISSMYNKVTAQIKTYNGLTESFPVFVGTRQGCNLSPALFNCFMNDLPPILDNMNAHQPCLGKRKIGCLLYADDLVIMSRTPGGLQSMMTAAEKYCNKWQLVINTSKTKILVAHKRKLDNSTWEIYGNNVEIVDSFCYLGIEINKAGTFKNAIQRLYNKGHKAYLGIRQQFNFNNGTSVKVLLKLFDTMVQPILTYGSEIWGVFGWRKNSFPCIRNYVLGNHIYEKLHNKLCKQALGIDRYTPDDISKSELGRLPIMYKIISLIYGYWQHILTDTNSLAYEALSVNIRLDRKGFNSYYTRVKSILAIFNEKNKIYPINDKEVKKEGTKLSMKFANMYKMTFFQKLNTLQRSPESKGKYNIYCHIKKNYTPEKYLHEIQDSKLRRHITGVRCATNILPVNKLRKRNIRRENRLCELCDSNEIGDEYHTIIECQNPKLVLHRKELFTLSKEISPQTESLNNKQIFYYMIQGIEKEITIYFAVYLDKIYKIIKSLKHPKH